jgi:hypothetical protein
MQFALGSTRQAGHLRTKLKLRMMSLIIYIYDFDLPYDYTTDNQEV